MNYIWFFIIFISIVCAAFTGRIDAVVRAVLEGAQKSVEVALYLAGIMAFWLGIMRIAVYCRTFDPDSQKAFPRNP